MKDVEGWKVGMSPYYSQKFMPRAVNVFDRGQKQGVNKNMFLFHKLHELKKKHDNDAMSETL